MSINIISIKPDLLLHWFLHQEFFFIAKKDCWKIIELVEQNIDECMYNVENFMNFIILFSEVFFY